MNNDNGPRKYAPPGPLLLEPSAFGMAIMMAPEPPATRVVDGVAVVPVRGPLMQHADPFCDSYEAIRERVGAALAGGKVRAVVLEISSPGGMVAGCFETARELRAMCDGARVPLVAYVDGQATSAAYALASSASKIVIPPTGIVGSIGCISELVDSSALDAAMGLRVSVVASGSRKLHGNTHVPTSDAAMATAQSIVDELAEEFFAHVASAGRVSRDALRAMDGGLYIGARAVRMGLADVVGGLGDALDVGATRAAAARVVARPASLASAAPMAISGLGAARPAAPVLPVRAAAPAASAPARPQPRKEDVPMLTADLLARIQRLEARANAGGDFSKIRQALREIAAGDDEKEARAAKRMLAELETDDAEEPKGQRKTRAAKGDGDTVDNPLEARPLPKPRPGSSAVTYLSPESMMMDRVMGIARGGALVEVRGTQQRFSAARPAPAPRTPSTKASTTKRAPASAVSRLSPEAAELDRAFGLVPQVGVRRERNSLVFGLVGDDR